jgi:Protein of unknown function (DUF3800)
MNPRKEVFVYLAYMDDSGSDSQSGVAAFGAVVMHDEDFSTAEAHLGVVLEELLPPDRIQKFERFHASELYSGHGIFEGIPEPKRHGAAANLIEFLGYPTKFKIGFVYSAVSKAAILESPFSSANPIDVAFRMCALGVEEWMKEHSKGDLCIYICDDFTTEEKPDNKIKADIRRSFRILRGKYGPPTWTPQRLEHAHDSMYFGSSKDSVGLQIADLCTNSVYRQLISKKQEKDFLSGVRDYVICSKAEPEWSTYQGAMIFLEV